MKASIWTVVATGHGLPLVVFNLTQEQVAVGVVLYSTLGIAPIGMWLAESIMLIDRARRRSANEHGTGSTLAMSTAGNVAGALLTAWVILSTLGMAGATALVALVSGGAAVAAHRRAWGWETALFIVALLGIYGYHEQTEYRARTAYADYQLVENKTNGTRELIVNRSRASTDDGSGTGHPYIEAIETALCSLEIKQVAVLGAAGRTLGEGADCDIQPTFVDIDPAQAEMSQELLERPPQGTLQIADARAWLRNNEVLWPAIVADAYSHRASLPTHLATVEAFEAMREVSSGRTICGDCGTRSGRAAGCRHAIQRIRAIPTTASTAGRKKAPTHWSASGASCWSPGRWSTRPGSARARRRSTSQAQTCT